MTDLNDLTSFQLEEWLFILRLEGTLTAKDERAILEELASRHNGLHQQLNLLW